MCGFIGIVVCTCEMKQLENLWVWEVASKGREDRKISISENRMLKPILGLNRYKVTG